MVELAIKRVLYKLAHMLVHMLVYSVSTTLLWHHILEKINCYMGIKMILLLYLTHFQLIVPIMQHVFNALLWR